MSDHQFETTPATPRSKTALPRRVRVAAVLSSRYEPGSRPILWDQRESGIEKIKTDDGDEIMLFSNGGQSSPAPGWELLLLKDRHNPAAAESPDKSALLWTLYGLPNVSTMKNSTVKNSTAKNSAVK